MQRYMMSATIADMRTKFKKYLPEFVYGGIDGAVTTFAIVAGVVGASLSPTIILILGFANVLADGFSMGISNYLSQTSENDLRDSDRKNAKRTSYATFSAFIAIGMIPLSPYVVATMFSLPTQYLFVWSTSMTLVAFYIVGYLKGVFTHGRKHKSALQTLLMGTTAAFISYIVGFALSFIA